VAAAVTTAIFTIAVDGAMVASKDSSSQWAAARRRLLRSWRCYEIEVMRIDWVRHRGVYEARRACSFGADSRGAWTDEI